MAFVDVSYAALAVLAVGFVVAALLDVRSREVDDRIWLAIALLGGGLEAVAIAPGGALPLALWLLVLGFVVQHLVAWDDLFGESGSALAGYIELTAYIVVGLVLGLGIARDGIGPTAVPVGALDVYVSVLLARGLFELNLLYGGADAKAVMVAAAAVPVATTTLLPVPSSAAGFLGFYPFAITVLMNGAFAAVVVPLALLARNAVHGEWNGWKTFSGYPLPVDELPNRFVWVADPTFRRDDDVETAEEDRKVRERLRDELKAKGISMVWVTPQVPFVVLLAAGVVLAALFGNVLVDVLAAL